MFDFSLGAFVGLIVGWNILPQPKWIDDAYKNFVKFVHDKIKS